MSLAAQPTPGAEPGDQLRLHMAALAEELVRQQTASQPDLMARYGPGGPEKCLQDAAYHLASLADAMTAGDSALFVTYVQWAAAMLASRDIPVEDLVRMLGMLRSVIAGRLGGGDAALATEYLDAGLENLPSSPEPLVTRIAPDAPHAALAHDYLGALLAGERHVASRMILQAVGAGVPVKEIYVHVFQPSQHEVGRRWQLNEISVAQEHYCTAATQLIMSQLYPAIFAIEKNGSTLVSTCVAGDLHEIGVRMVTDFFELEGWNTYYLGASTPARAVLDTVVQRRADVLGISATMIFHLRAVRELIRLVRDHPACSRVRILVGGHPFLIAPGLWRRLGADGCALGAQDAVSLARRLVGRDGGA